MKRFCVIFTAFLLAACSGGVKLDPGIGIERKVTTPDGGVTSDEGYLKLRVGEVTGTTESPVPSVPKMPDVKLEVAAPRIPEALVWGILAIMATGVGVLALRRKP